MPKIIHRFRSDIYNKLKKCLPDRVLIKLGEVKHNLLNFYKYGSFDMFSTIGIETITACNRRCRYCPNSKFDRGLIKNTKKMEPALFYKIIDELRKLKWKGEICPQFYGEPLLDDRLSCLLKYVKDALPQSKIVIFTNGDFLTVDLYKELIKAGVKEFHITQHSEEVPVNMKEVLDYRKEHGDDSIPLSYYKLKEFFNRGGLIEIENVEKVKNCKLRVSGDEIGVNYAGDIIFCCNDYLGTVKMGNISNEKLIDIWRKPYYRMLRKELRKNIFRLDVCKKCKKGTRLK